MNYLYLNMIYGNNLAENHFVVSEGYPEPEEKK